MDKEKFFSLLKSGRSKPQESVRSNLPMVISDPAKTKLALETALTILHKEKYRIPTEEPIFLKNLQLMGEAIDQDRTQIISTEDLGFSQALRLRSFLKAVDGQTEGKT